MKFNETKSQERLINLMLQAGVEWLGKARHAMQGGCFGKVPGRALLAIDWSHTDNDGDIIAYRIHKEQQEAHDENYALPAEPCKSVAACIPDQPTIEQLIVEYRQRVKEQEAEHEKLQAQGDVHAESIRRMSEAGDAVRAALAKAGWGVETIKVSENNEQPVITDWRDLLVGDVVWWYGRQIGEQVSDPGEFMITSVENKSYNGRLNIKVGHFWFDASDDGDNWYFIRRPAKGGQNA